MIGKSYVRRVRISGAFLTGAPCAIEPNADKYPPLPALLVTGSVFPKQSIVQGVPRGAEIVHAEWNEADGTLDLLLSHESFAELSGGRDIDILVHSEPEGST